MASYPVMFTLRDTVSGNGFLAGITLTGRALMKREDDEKWWIYGVRPAAIARVAALRKKRSCVSEMHTRTSCMISRIVVHL